ncbi:MAG: FAD-dependent monooxygenase [Rhodospirillales bacterium]|nr:MAG: FAD-dependent monooxygenase [Rhodospirillales bacterium]
MVKSHTRVLIAGGGPAGAAVAVSLARLGHRPLLIAAPRRQPALEGFSDRTLRALETLGLEHARAAVGARVLRAAYWAGERNQVNEEYIVDREAFDTALLADVRAHDIEVLQDRVMRTTRSQERWDLRLSSYGAMTTDLLVEARGRAAPAPPRTRRSGPATVSLARCWTGVDADPATSIAAMRDGWAWYAAPGGGAAILQFLVAATPGDLPKRAGLVEFFDQILSGCEIARHWIADGRSHGPVVVRRANPVCAQRPFDDGRIRVGDAALAPDPLSGHGVYVALGGAQAAAVAVNTLLRRPASAALARTFYEERCRLDFMRLARVGRAFYAREGRWRDSLFWQARRTWPDASPPHPPMDSHPPRIETRPVVEHGFITQHEVVVTPDHPRGVWVVDGVPLVPLLRALQEPEDPPDIEQLAAGLGRSAASVRIAQSWLKQRFRL